MRTAAVVCMLVLASLSHLGLAGCTVVKPVVCSVGYPVRTIGEALNKQEDEERQGEEKYKSTPTVLAVPTAIVVVPVAFAGLSAVGIIGGLTSGVASDLNLLLGNADFDDTRESLPYPFRTNVQKPDK